MKLHSVALFCMRSSIKIIHTQPMIYDLIIIGVGSAGFNAYKKVIKHTHNILIIHSGAWNTTCARVPNKVLISSANQLYDAKMRYITCYGTCLYIT